MSPSTKRKCRQLVVVLGDQLDPQSAAFDGFDASRDVVLLTEARQEATYIPQHKLRLAFFFSAMRHFRDAQRRAGWEVIYREMDDPANRGTLLDEVRFWAESLQAQRIVLVEPGDWRVRQALEGLAPRVEFRPDRHFLCSPESFAAFARGRERLVLENFYRLMRKRLNVLMTPDGKPLGGAWNFDRENRARLPPGTSVTIPTMPVFAPDALTQQVLGMVRRQFPSSPGRCDTFGYPVTRERARAALKDFLTHRLEHFGRYQDAMREGEPSLFHSQLSGPLNLHLLRPKEVLEAVLAHEGRAPLNSVEGFVRQLIGWREYVRGIYQHFMPQYARENALEAQLPMPRFYWTGETDMRCLAEAIAHTIDHAYAHHIERLMVLGLFALLLGVRPYDVHRWHISMFWDAIDWVSLPNVIGMSQHADGGRMATKPYVASGNYIQRMGGHCARCRYDPRQATGDTACPFTTLYWDFLQRHRARFAGNPRMLYAYRHLESKTAGELAAIRRLAHLLQNRFTEKTFL